MSLTIRRENYNDAAGTDGGDAFIDLHVLYEGKVVTMINVNFGDDNNPYGAEIRVRPANKNDMSPPFFNTHLDLGCAVWGYVTSQFYGSDGSNGEFYSSMFENEDGEEIELTFDVT